MSHVRNTEDKLFLHGLKLHGFRLLHLRKQVLCNQDGSFFPDCRQVTSAGRNLASICLLALLFAFTYFLVYFWSKILNTPVTLFWGEFACDLINFVKILDNTFVMFFNLHSFTYVFANQISNFRQVELLTG